MTYQAKSLNKSYRKQVRIKINSENRQIFKRLINLKSSYSIRKWNKEYRDREKILANISEYPYPIKKTQLILPKITNFDNDKEQLMKSYKNNKDIIQAKCKYLYT